VGVVLEPYPKLFFAISAGSRVQAPKCTPRASPSATPKCNPFVPRQIPSMLGVCSALAVVSAAMAGGGNGYRCCLAPVLWRVY